MKKSTIALAFIATLGSYTTQAQSKKAIKAELATAKKSLDSLNKLIIPKQNLTSLKDSFSYALGADLFINNIEAQGLDKQLTADAFYLGFKSAENHQVAMPQEERDALIQSVFQKINESKQTEEGNESEVTNANAQANLEKGSAFLALNSKAPGVKTLASGLQYKVLSTGDAKSVSPKTTSNVTVNYEGKLIDGTVFDSSYERGTPASFPVNGVIKGWTEILQLMHKGDKWEVYIPSDLAYGANGAGGKIGPNETLIFKVELLEIN